MTTTNSANARSAPRLTSNEWRRRTLLKAGVIGLASAAGLVATSGTRRATAADPIPVGGTVRALRDSIGVNVHWSYPDTPYGAAYDKVRALLTDSGVKQVRGEATRAADLYTAGIRTTVISDIQPDGTGTPAAQMAVITDLAANGAIAAVEGPNEADLFWTAKDWTYRGEPFPQGTVLWQEDLWAAVKQDSRTSNLPVIGPSLGGTYWEGGRPFADRSLEPYVDFGNFHPYPTGNSHADQYPYAGITQYYRFSNFPSNTLDRYPINFAAYRPPFGDKPMMATETGYSTYKLGQSERVQGLYAPRILLENFRLGVARTFLYELVDEFADATGANREAHFGLLRRNLAPKPAYYALKGLLSWLQMTSGTQVPFSPSIAVTAPDGYDPSALHSLLLAKGGSRYLLALWHEVSANDLSGLDATPPKRPIELTHPPMSVTVSPGRVVSKITARQFTATGTLQPQSMVIQGNDIGLSVSEYVTLLDVQL